jgi:hypothetical protein
MPLHFEGDIAAFKASVLEQQRAQVRDAFRGLDPGFVERLATEEARRFEAALPAFSFKRASATAFLLASKIRAGEFTASDRSVLREAIVKLAADAGANYDAPQEMCDFDGRPRPASDTGPVARRALRELRDALIGDGFRRPSKGLVSREANVTLTFAEWAPSIFQAEGWSFVDIGFVNLLLSLGELSRANVAPACTRARKSLKSIFGELGAEKKGTAKKLSLWRGDLFRRLTIRGILSLVAECARTIQVCAEVARRRKKGACRSISARDVFREVLDEQVAEETARVTPADRAGLDMADWWRLYEVTGLLLAKHSSPRGVRTALGLSRRGYRQVSKHLEQ